PRLDDNNDHELATIPGVVPGLLDLPQGCAFCTRCPQAVDRCFKAAPPCLFPHQGHMVRCWLYE
ncbi:MAG: peptide ABC transporter ATP-binding protein, partial [Desulfoplanes sp.]|nr:peptide ABC transporter ATP-binding protein [Desulfoplanes sp.]